MKLIVDEAIFENYPGLTIGVVVARSVDNRPDSDGPATRLREETDRIRNNWTLERLDSEPRIQSWREAYRSFRAKPKKYRCSVENMYRMILEGQNVPSINKAVDIYNAISLEYCLPAGGDDLDRVEGDIRLTFAAGGERFIPLNGTESRPPKPGEVIYRDAEEVLCRRWNWRECDKTKMTPESRNLVLVVEGLPPFSKEDIERISAKLERNIGDSCGGSVTRHLIDCFSPNSYLL